MDEDLDFIVFKKLETADARFCTLDIIDEFRQLSQKIGCNIFNSESRYNNLLDYLGKHIFVFIECFN